MALTRNVFHFLLVSTWISFAYCLDLVPNPLLVNFEFHTSGIYFTTPVENIATITASVSKEPFSDTNAGVTIKTINSVDIIPSGDPFKFGLCASQFAELPIGTVIYIQYKITDANGEQSEQTDEKTLLPGGLQPDTNDFISECSIVLDYTIDFFTNGPLIKVKSENIKSLTARFSTIPFNGDITYGGIYGKSINAADLVPKDSDFIFAVCIPQLAELKPKATIYVWYLVTDYNDVVSNQYVPYEVPEGGPQPDTNDFISECSIVLDYTIDFFTNGPLIKVKSENIKSLTARFSTIPFNGDITYGGIYGKSINAADLVPKDSDFIFAVCIPQLAELKPKATIYVWYLVTDYNDVVSNQYVPYEVPEGGPQPDTNDFISECSIVLDYTIDFFTNGPLIKVKTKNIKSLTARFSTIPFNGDITYGGIYGKSINAADLVPKDSDFIFAVCIPQLAELKPKTTIYVWYLVTDYNDVVSSQYVPYEVPEGGPQPDTNDFISECSIVLDYTIDFFTNGPLIKVKSKNIKSLTARFSTIPFNGDITYGGIYGKSINAADLVPKDSDFIFAVCIPQLAELKPKTTIYVWYLVTDYNDVVSSQYVPYEVPEGGPQPDTNDFISECSIVLDYTIDFFTNGPLIKVKSENIKSLTTRFSTIPFNGDITYGGIYGKSINAADLVPKDSDFIFAVCIPQLAELKPKTTIYVWYLVTDYNDVVSSQYVPYEVPEGGPQPDTNDFISECSIVLDYTIDFFTNGPLIKVKSKNIKSLTARFSTIPFNGDITYGGIYGKSINAADLVPKDSDFIFAVCIPQLAELKPKTTIYVWYLVTDYNDVVSSQYVPYEVPEGGPQPDTNDFISECSIVLDYTIDFFTNGPLIKVKSKNIKSLTARFSTIPFNGDITYGGIYGKSINAADLVPKDSDFIFAVCIPQLAELKPKTTIYVWYLVTDYNDVVSSQYVPYEVPEGGPQPDTNDFISECSIVLDYTIDFFTNGPLIKVKSKNIKSLTARFSTIPFNGDITYGGIYGKSINAADLVPKDSDFIFAVCIPQLAELKPKTTIYVWYLVTDYNDVVSSQYVPYEVPEGGPQPDTNDFISECSIVLNVDIDFFESGPLLKVGSEDIKILTARFSTIPFNADIRYGGVYGKSINAVQLNSEDSGFIFAACIQPLANLAGRSKLYIWYSILDAKDVSSDQYWDYAVPSEGPKPDTEELTGLCSA